MAKKFTVTPWKVEGEVDYGRLIREFGTEPITDSLLARIRKHTGELHHFLRRKIFFSHREMGWLLDQYERGDKFYLYTGRGPSGNTHLGHLVPWLFTKWLQDKFDSELWFQMTDDEKFLFNDSLSLEESNSMAYENALDVIALGFKQGKTFIFADTDYSKTLYKHALKVSKRLTVSTAKAAFGFTDSNTVGQYFYTSMQSVPAFLPSALKGKNIPCLIPHAIDQDPHFRITRDIVPKLGYYKPAAIHSVFLPSLEGPKGKMSSSIGESAVYTTDTPELVEKKIRKYAFSGGRDTVVEHRKKGGNPEIDVSYQWLRFFEESDEKLKAVHGDYKSGRLLTGELKQILIDKLTVFLKRHQEAREKARKVLDRFVIMD
ncbi:tryptophan--tRNA ligase [Candidatus Woesearchaeota archaeon]|nr:tryptophan--tRNA ligase [Candidatus Woesearchaeota archaeon]